MSLIMKASGLMFILFYIFMNITKSMMKFIHESDLNSRGLFVGIRRTLVSLYNTLDMTRAFNNLTGEMCPVRVIGETDDSFLKRRFRWLDKILNAAHMHEAAKYSTSDAKTLRDEIGRDPLFNNIVGQRGADNTDIIFNNAKPPAEQRSMRRQRTFDSTPIGFVIFWVCNAIASSEKARSILNGYASRGVYIPRVLHEQLNSVRRSTAGNIMITPRVVAFQDDLLDALGLRETLLDFNYMLTDQGIARFLELCARIRQYSGNYIDFVEYTKVVTFTSNFQTTLMAWTSFYAPSENVLITTIADRVGAVDIPEMTVIQSVTEMVDHMELLPNHSYGTDINDVQLGDGYIRAQQLTRQDTGTPVQPDVFSVANFELPWSTNQKILFILDRVASDDALKNDKRVNNPSPPKNGQGKGNGQPNGNGSPDSYKSISLPNSSSFVGNKTFDARTFFKILSQTRGLHWKLRNSIIDLMLPLGASLFNTNKKRSSNKRRFAVV